MEIVRLIISLLSLPCSIWCMIELLKQKVKYDRDAITEMKAMVYLYKRTGYGDDEASELLYKLVKDEL